MGQDSDISQVGRFMKEKRVNNAAMRRKFNFAFLEAKGIPWVWVDKECDHILMLGVIDYYPGSTFWYDRTTKQKGWNMLYKLLKMEVLQHAGNRAVVGDMGSKD
mgnify:CR=1 FL=1